MYTRRDYASGTSREISYDWGRIGLNTHGLNDMSIFVEPEMRGHNLSRRLIRELLAILQRENTVPDFVYIDTDASSGFWEKVGFLPNPYLDDTTRPEFGYEMRVTALSLTAFAHTT